MPYINQNRRDVLNAGLESPKNAGELNYVFTINALEYLNGKEMNYQLLNDVIGALEGAKAEFQRRIVVPYEIQKCYINSDVYNQE